MERNDKINQQYLDDCMQQNQRCPDYLELQAFRATSLTPEEISTMKAENEQWDDLDCGNCPLMGVPECDTICKSKASLMAYAISRNGGQ